MTDATTGGSVRGNDQESIDAGKCTRSWTRRPYKGATATTTYCEGALVAVTAANGGLLGYKCSHCKAQYTLKRQRIVDPPKPRLKK